MTTSYAQKLKDPRWQKLRLEILNRAKWACEHCGSKENTLHVHHSFYEFSREPWDYPPFSLKVLCENCHEHAEWVRSWLKRFLFSDELAVQDSVYELLLSLDNYPARDRGEVAKCLADLIRSVVKLDQDGIQSVMQKLLLIPLAKDHAE